MTASGPIFHVGLGRLGLGLVIPLLARSHRVIGCHRQSSENTRYDILREQLRYRRVFLDGAGDDEVELDAIAAYGDGGLGSIAADHGLPSVVTCAMKEGFPQIFPLLANLIADNLEHYRRTPLLFIPFENARNVGSDAYEYVTRRVPGASEALICADTAVDKVCSDADSKGGVCIVRTESRETLMIGIPAVVDEARTRAALAELGLAERILPREQFEFEVRKKAWIVNGLHYCIVMAAYERNLEADDIPTVLTDEWVADVARRFMFEVGVALAVYAADHHLSVTEDEILQFAEETLDRVRIVPDSVGRIAGRFLSPLHDFVVSVGAGIMMMPAPVTAGDTFRKWSERISEPAEIVLRVHTLFDDPLVTPRLCLRLLEWLGLYLTLVQPSSATTAAPARTT